VRVITKTMECLARSDWYNLLMEIANDLSKGESAVLAHEMPHRSLVVVREFTRPPGLL
jgi:hypothetical protein